jgi:SOS-response transcriptional repressor LexA
MNQYQEKILALLSDRGEFRGLPLREMAKMVGLNPDQPYAVQYHLDKLEKKGLISYDRKNKIIKRVETGTVRNDLVSVPILGTANCGAATIFADECWNGILQISEKLFPKAVNKEAVFAIEADGDSLNRAKIGPNHLSVESGDYVLVNSANKVPQNGDYVLSVVDGLGNIKKFSHDESTNRITLLSESTSNHPPIVLHESDDLSYFVGGVLFDVIKHGKDIYE